MVDEFLEDAELDDASWLMIDSDPFIESRPIKPLLKTPASEPKRSQPQAKAPVSASNAAKRTQASIPVQRAQPRMHQAASARRVANSHTKSQSAQPPKQATARHAANEPTGPSKAGKPDKLAESAKSAAQKTAASTRRRVVKALRDLPPQPQAQIQTDEETEAIIPIKKAPKVRYIIDVIPPSAHRRGHPPALKQPADSGQSSKKQKQEITADAVPKKAHAPTKKDDEAFRVTVHKKLAADSDSSTQATTTQPVRSEKTLSKDTVPSTDEFLHDHGDVHDIIDIIYEDRDPGRKKEIGKTLFTNRDAAVLRRNGYDFVIVDNINRFPALDRYRYANLLLGTDQQGVLAYNISAFPHIDRAEYAKNMIAVGRLHDIMRNIKKFPSVDPAELRAAINKQANEHILKGELR